MALDLERKRIFRINASGGEKGERCSPSGEGGGGDLERKEEFSGSNASGG